MVYRDLVVLIPSHGLEDFPTELTEQQAAGLLNAFSVIWHPALLNRCDSLPSWHRADDPPHAVEDRLFLVPEVSVDSLPHDWVDNATTRGAHVVCSLVDREDWLEAIPETSQVKPADSDDSAAEIEHASDFLAFGFCHLLVELLTRQMHYYSDLDEVLLQRELRAAAAAWDAGDVAISRQHLEKGFESLLEGRERFYPIDCFLIDLGLIVPELADEHFTAYLQEKTPANLLLLGEDLQQIERESPEAIACLKERLERGDLALVGGDLHEQPIPLVPLESMLWDLDQGRSATARILDAKPRTWGRRRYGFSTLLPQVLGKSGYHSALHIALDDGIYPDEEQSRIQWEGTDGSVIDALSRIPLAADSASSYLRLPQRMSEAMESDQVAALIFARWPEIKGPWYRDLQRIQNYFPVLGKFVTLDDFQQESDLPGRLSSFREAEYLSPFLVQLVAREDPDAISRFQNHQLRTRHWLCGEWLNQMARLLSGAPLHSDTELQKQLEDCGPDQRAECGDLNSALRTRLDEGLQQFAASVLQEDDSADPGLLIVNPHSTDWCAEVQVPHESPLPGLSEAVTGIQATKKGVLLQVKVPACGFRWIPCSNPPGQIPEIRTSLPIAEPWVLRNEFYEVHVNERTGGIAQIKEYGRKPNRLSQQLTFRFAQEKKYPDPERPDRMNRTFYANMVCEHLEVLASGPAFGEIESRGVLQDPGSTTELAGFRQRIRLWRGSRRLQIWSQIEPRTLPTGSPWATYYCSRFAWNDESASLTRSLLGMMHSFQGERIESPQVFEIATDSHRTALLSRGLTFHRRSGHRMLDTLLIVESESARSFEYAIELDHTCPLQASRQQMSPVPFIMTSHSSPRLSETGWLVHLSRRNVQLERILDPVNGGDCALRLLETEGRHVQLKLQLFRPVTAAYQRDLDGVRQQDCRLENGAVFVEIAGHGLCDLELEFE